MWPRTVPNKTHDGAWLSTFVDRGFSRVMFGAGAYTQYQTNITETVHIKIEQRPAL